MLKQETIFCVFAMHRIFSYTRLCLHAEFSPVQNFTTAMWDRWVDHHRKLLHWSTDMCELNSCWLFFSETLNVHMSCGAWRTPGAGEPGTSGAQLNAQPERHRRRRKPPRVARKEIRLVSLLYFLKNRRCCFLNFRKGCCLVWWPVGY